MKKRFSIYHFLIAVLIFSMFTPMTSVFANHSNGDGDGNGNNNGEVTGSLIIVKYSQDPKKDEVGQGEPGDGNQIDFGNLVGSPLKDVEYTIKQTHSYDPSTDKWTELSEEEGETYTRTTGDDGRIVIDPIPLGRYTVQETAWPDHVVPDEREYTVDIPMTSEDGSSVNYDVHIYPKNEIIRGGAILTKFKNDTEETLDGVQFKVYNDKDEAVTGDNGEDLVLTTENGVVTVEGLEYGDYYFQEIKSVDGFLLNGEKVEFSVSKQGEVTGVELHNYSEPEVEKEVSEPKVNRGDTVTYTITVDLPADINSYESFVITDVLHEHLTYVDESADEPNGFTFSQV